MMRYFGHFLNKTFIGSSGSGPAPSGSTRITDASDTRISDAGDTRVTD